MADVIGRNQNATPTPWCLGFPLTTWETYIVGVDRR